MPDTTEKDRLIAMARLALEGYGYTVIPPDVEGTQGDSGPAPNRSTTPRGFTTFDEFRDSHNTKITIGESSLVGGPFVWVFSDERDAHLTIGQAKRLRNALGVFIAENQEANANAH